MLHNLIQQYLDCRDAVSSKLLEVLQTFGYPGVADAFVVDWSQVSLSHFEVTLNDGRRTLIPTFVMKAEDPIAAARRWALGSLQ